MHTQDKANSPGSVAGAGITRRRLVQYGVGAGAGLLMWRFPAPGAGRRPVRSCATCERPHRSGRPRPLDPEVRHAAGDPAGDAAQQSLPGKPRAGIDYYEIAVREFSQHILPASMGLDPTTVWSYGSVNHPETFNYPAFTIEAAGGGRRGSSGSTTSSSRTANSDPTCCRSTRRFTGPTRRRRAASRRPRARPGPLPGPGADRHPPSRRPQHGGERRLPRGLVPASCAQYPGGVCQEGSFYRTFKAQAQAKLHQAWTPGSAVFQYDNDQRATTMWYHDHTLGMTRANVYAGPAGFYLLRGGPDDDAVVGTLPGPAPALGDPPGLDYFEIPIAIQDRSFNDDGSLFYPDNRAYFEGLDPSQLQIPFAPDPACDGPSDVAPIWNPEFFGNAIVVNGKTWPELEVQPRRYRFRLLNGCNSRFLILRMDNDLPFWQIGNEGGFLPAPIELTEVLLGPAERADVIVDFTDVPIRHPGDHPAEHRPRRAVRRRRSRGRLRAGQPGYDRAGDALSRRPGDGSRPEHAAGPARAPGARRARGRHQHAPGVAQRAGLGDGVH